MIIYEIRPDFVYGGSVEVPDSTTTIPSNYTFEAPPAIPEGQHAVMGPVGWMLQEGPAPQYPSAAQVAADNQQANKSQAEAILSSTDWTTIPDVANPDVSDPYLTNAADFAAYRSQVRAIAVNPPTTLVTNWPVKPEEIWAPGNPQANVEPVVV